MKGLVVVAAPTARSRAYAGALAEHGIDPERVLCLGGAPVAGFDAWPTDVLEAKHVGDERIERWLEGVEPALVVYSGFGGQIVPARLLGRVPFLHVHAGRLPEYRGSTTMHFMLLREGGCTATAILLEPQIDTGRIVMTRDYPPPPPGIELDAWDATIRADLLGRVLDAGMARIGRARPQATEGAETYFVIHPVLKRLAAERARRP